jgi:hypothetical protein
MSAAGWRCIEREDEPAGEDGLALLEIGEEVRNLLRRGKRTIRANSG